MSGHWDLSDDELAARLRQRGVAEDRAARLVAQRDTDGGAYLIEQALDG